MTDTKISIPVRAYQRDDYWNGRRWVLRHYVHVGELSASASTLAAAKAEIVDEITKLIEIYQPPKLLTYKDRTIVLYPTTQGVASKSTNGCTSISDRSWAEAESAALYDLAQGGVDPHDDDSVVEALKILKPYRTTYGSDWGAVEFLSWVGFQRAYAKHAFTEGSDTACHEFACSHAYEYSPNYLIEKVAVRERKSA